MNTVWIKWLVMGLVIGLVLSACAPRHPRYPPPVDYERLELKMAALREAGIIGPRGFDDEAWTDIELRLLAADNYLTRIEQRNRQISNDIFNRVERAVVARRQQMQVDYSFFLAVLKRSERSYDSRVQQPIQHRQISYALLDRVERSRELLRQQREERRRAAQAIIDESRRNNALLRQQREDARRDNLEKLTELDLITVEDTE